MFVTEKEGEGSLRVVEAGEGRGSVTVRLRHILEVSCGIHILQISCTLWVYNCAGLPIALQQSTDEEDEALVSKACCTNICKPAESFYIPINFPSETTRE